MTAEWWKFWKWHVHRCRTECDDSGCWGECVTCGKRVGYVTREQLRAYADWEVDREIERRSQRSKHELGRRKQMSKIQRFSINTSATPAGRSGSIAHLSPNPVGDWCLYEQVIQAEQVESSELLFIEKQILKDIAALVRAHARTIEAQPSSQFLLPVKNSIKELKDLAEKLEVIAK